MDSGDSLLATVERLLQAGPAPDNLMDEIVTLLGEAFDYIDVGLLLADPADPGWLLLRASNYAGFPNAVGTYRQPAAAGVIGRALRFGRQLLVADVQHDPDYQPLPGVPVQAELVTLIRAEGEVLGVLNIESLHPISAAEAAQVAVVTNLLGAYLKARP